MSRVRDVTQVLTLRADFNEIIVLIFMFSGLRRSPVELDWTSTLTITYNVRIMNYCRRFS